MTTITTSHPRTPLIAALAAGAALVVGGAMGVVWEQNHTDTPTATHVQSTTPEKFAGATTSDEISGSVPAARSLGGATTSEELSGSTSGFIPATGSPGGATSSQESTR
jgi:hypothetical protein